MEFVSGPPTEGCFICDAVSSEDDESALVVFRTERTIVLMNRYPYNTGHLLVAPNAHEGSLGGLDGPTRSELMETLNRCVGTLTQAMEPHGFNLGANLGEVAGAGLPGHLHLHVVPRWPGDTNFMPVVGGSKVIPESLEATYRRLRSAF